MTEEVRNKESSLKLSYSLKSTVPNRFNCTIICTETYLNVK